MIRHRYVKTRPRSCVGLNPRRDIAVDRASVRPTRSASSRVATFPACATTPDPSAENDRPVDHVVCFNCEVPSA